MPTIQQNFVKVLGTGSFLPGNPVPFDDIDSYLGEITQAPAQVLRWLKRTKNIMKEILEIEYFHYAIDPQTKERNEDEITMSVKAANRALEAANMRAEDIEVITYGSPCALQMPSTSTRIQEALGIAKCADLQIHANCTSAYKALLTAHDMLRCGRYKNALVVSSTLNSPVFSAGYYNQEVVKVEDVLLRWFLCDGAGAVVLQACEENKNGLFLDATHIESLGGKKAPVMYNRMPAYFVDYRKVIQEGLHHVCQLAGNEIVDRVVDDNKVTIFTNGLQRMVQRYSVDLSKLRFFQLNMPTKHVVEVILGECNSILGIPKEKLYTRISKMGYPGPPAVFISLDALMREEKLNHDDVILSFVLEVSKLLVAGFSMSYKEEK